MVLSCRGEFRAWSKALTTVAAFGGLLWLLAALIIFIFLQRALHREIQAVMLIVTRSAGVSQVLFALIFFPGC